MKILSIPAERKAVLIGKDGQTKRKIEKLTNTRLSVKDHVEIDGDPVDCLKTGEIVKAIGRGFAPETALELVNEEKVLFIVEVKGTDKKIKRQLARVIGTHGKAKKTIEFLTGTHISIYGKTISVIGKYEDAKNAQEAIENILSGSRHGYVYKGLERVKAHTKK